MKKQYRCNASDLEILSIGEDHILVGDRHRLLNIPVTFRQCHTGVSDGEVTRYFGSIIELHFEDLKTLVFAISSYDWWSVGLQGRGFDYVSWYINGQHRDISSCRGMSKEV